MRGDVEGEIENVWAIAWPLIITNILNVTVGIIDLKMVGILGYQPIAVFVITPVGYLTSRGFLIALGASDRVIDLGDQYLKTCSSGSGRLGSRSFCSSA